MLASLVQPFIPGPDQLRPFVAELWLIATIVAVLIVPFFTRHSNRACGAISFAGLLLALGSLLIETGAARAAGPQLAGMLLSDSPAVLWKCLLLLFASGVVLMWFTTTSAKLHEGDGPEFFTLLLGATLGMCLMASTSNLLMLFLAVEMASLPSYVLAGFRKTDRMGSEASLKYVLFGAASSSVMVYGLSMLYGLGGSLQLEVIAARIAEQGVSLPLILGLAGLIVGIGFKISAVPLHFWCPDVFEGAGMDVAAFLSVASKGAGLTLLLRVLMIFADALHHQGPVLVALAAVIGVLGVITATVGNTAAYVQTNIKRLLAYSSIAHAGYMLCLLSLLVHPAAGETGGAGTGGASQAASALLVYLAVYLFMNLGAFTAAGLVLRGTGGETLDDYRGLGQRNPLLAACMAIFMFSLVGLPPFAGFAAKLNLMMVLARSGGLWWVLVAAVGVNTVFSLYYYARVVRAMYLDSTDAPALSAQPMGLALCVGCAAMLVAMMVLFNPLLRLASDYGQLLGFAR